MKSKCKGRSKNGKPCRNNPVGDTQYCRQHIPLELINKNSHESIRIPNTVFWFVVGAVGEAVINDIYGYVKGKLGYEFVIPPIKRPEDSPTPTPSASIEVTATSSATHTPLVTPTPEPTRPPTPLPTHQELNVWSNQDEERIASALGIGGASILSMLPAATHIPDDDFTSPSIPPIDAHYLNLAWYADDKRERIYMDEKILTPLVGSSTSKPLYHIPAGDYDSNIGEIFFVIFAFSVIATVVYMIALGNTKHSKSQTLEEGAFERKVARIRAAKGDAIEREVARLRAAKKAGTKLRCANCSTTYDAGDQLCRQCGRKL